MSVIEFPNEPRRANRVLGLGVAASVAAALADQPAPAPIGRTVIEGSEAELLFGAILSEHQGVERRMEQGEWQWHWPHEFDGLEGPIPAEGEWRDHPPLMVNDGYVDRLFAILNQLAMESGGEQFLVHWRMRTSPPPPDSAEPRRWFIVEIIEPVGMTPKCSGSSQSMAIAIAVSLCRLFDLDFLEFHRVLFPHKYVEGGA